MSGGPTGPLPPGDCRMRKLRAKVEKGRLIVDTPTTLPEGTVLDLVVDDDGDDLTDDERAALHAAIKDSAEADSGRPAAEVLHDLRKRR